MKLFRRSSSDRYVVVALGGLVAMLGLYYYATHRIMSRFDAVQALIALPAGSHEWEKTYSSFSPTALLPVYGPNSQYRYRNDHPNPSADSQLILNEMMAQKFTGVTSSTGQYGWRVSGVALNTTIKLFVDGEGNDLKEEACNENTCSRYINDR